MTTQEARNIVNVLIDREPTSVDYVCARYKIDNVTFSIFPESLLVENEETLQNISLNLSSADSNVLEQKIAVWYSSAKSRLEQDVADIIGSLST